jgi:hypothetical protein
VSSAFTSGSGKPPRGAVVIYTQGTWLDGRERFRIAEVVGPTIVDPESGGTWMGVLIPATPARIDLIDTARVTNIVSST